MSANFQIEHRLNDSTVLRISSDDRDSLLGHLIFFGIVSEKAPDEAPAEQPAPVVDTDADLVKNRPSRKKKEAAAAPAPVVEEPVAEEPAPVVEEPKPEPAPAAPASDVTPAMAAAAVRAYGALHGIDAARTKLKECGFARTADITPEAAAAVAAAFAEAQ